jgi:hypothetical protein
VREPEQVSAQAAAAIPSVAPPPDPAPAASPQPPDAAKPPARAAPVSTTPVSVPRARRPPQYAWWLHGSALLASGVAPSARFGGAFGASLVSVYQPRLQLGVGLGLRMVQAYSSQREQGLISMAWWSGSGLVCAGPRLGTRAALDTCLAGELGRLRARGRETREAASSDRLWAALGPAARARLRLFGPVSVEGGLAALLPFARHRYLLAEQRVHSVPRLTFRVELGVAVQIR